MTKRGKKNNKRFKEFLAEAEEILGTMGAGLLKLGKGVKAGVIDHTVLNGIFRNAHTLKGMSGIFEFTEMTELAHALEDTLDMLRLDRIELDNDVLGCVIDAHELLTRMVGSKESAESHGEFAEEVSALKARLVETRHQKKPRVKADIDKELLSVLTEYEAHRLRENLKDRKNVYTVTVSFPITSFDRGYARATEVLSSETEIIATLPSSKTNSETLYFDILVGTTRDSGFVKDLLKDVTDPEITPLAGIAAEEPQAASPALEVVPGDTAPQTDTVKRISNTVRVDISKLDKIMHTISELSIFKADIERLGAELKNEREISVYGIELSRSEKYLERKLAELRDSVLDVRMVPIGSLFGRFDTFLERITRDSGKEIRVMTYGDETELDKLIIEELADPLMHIIRNIADHAIEDPEVRESLGKPRVGTITLSALQKGNHVVVEIKDDGAGIDVEEVRKRAVEKELISSEDVGALSEQEALELIFLPGFSTREDVTETSGRGVGMDVVKENITKLSGIIDLDTRVGKGTRIVLTIPITLAIIQALIVEAGGTRYAVPLNSVLEIIELSSVAAAQAEATEKITKKDRNIPAVRLSSFFGKSFDPSRRSFYGIVAGLAEHRICVVVDRLVEELDVVIKPLSRILRVTGVAGAADMGEKGTMLVLDMTGILESVQKERKTAKTV